jgi:response regulator of citrate/malate metabolism
VSDHLGIVERLLRSGVSAYLTKPLDVDHFIETGRRFVGAA